MASMASREECVGQSRQTFVFTCDSGKPSVTATVCYEQ
jgi:hypothetical protein